jgi:hypothetical protein
MANLQLQALVNDGTIVLFSTASRPANFLPPPLPPNAGDQPVSEATQGYPSMRALLATFNGNVSPSDSVGVHELNQD